MLDAISFVASGGLINLIRRREGSAERPTPRGPILVEVREGLSVVLGNPLLRSIAACTGTFNFFSSAFFALYILFATRELKLGPAQIGVISSIGGVAGLIGALTAERLANRLGVWVGPLWVRLCFSGLLKSPWRLLQREQRGF